MNEITRIQPQTIEIGTAQPIKPEDVRPDTPLYVLFNIFRDHKLAFANKQTIYQYEYNLARFADYLRREPLVSDLTDVKIAACMKWLVTRPARKQKKQLSNVTANKLRDNFCALWKWLSFKGYVKGFPDVPMLKEPKCVPVAWTREQLTQLWEMCDKQPGHIGAVPARLWWLSLHMVAWDTGERIGALLQTEWNSVDFGQNGKDSYITVRAEHRKGGRTERLYKLHPSTVEILTHASYPERKLIWPWDKTESYLWVFYTVLLRSVGLPHDRKHKFHALRRSAASFVEAAGFDAQKFLDHASRNDTVKSYLDPRFVQQQHGSDILFRPDQKALPAPEPEPEPEKPAPSVNWGAMASRQATQEQPIDPIDPVDPLDASAFM